MYIYIYGCHEIYESHRMSSLSWDMLHRPRRLPRVAPFHAFKAHTVHCIKGLSGVSVRAKSNGIQRWTYPQHLKWENHPIYFQISL